MPQILIILLLICCPSVSLADAAFPMVGILAPVLWLSLIPIILIEWWTMYKRLKNPSRKELLKITTISNVSSSIIGVPICAVALYATFALSMHSGQSDVYFVGIIQNILTSTVFIHSGLMSHPWLLPAILILWLIPLFFLSYWIELWITLWLMRKNQAVPRDDIKKAVWKANINSYLFLLVIEICVFGLLILRG